MTGWGSYGSQGVVFAFVRVSCMDDGFSMLFFSRVSASGSCALALAVC